MKNWLLPLLICPKSGEALQLSDAAYSGDDIISGWLISHEGGVRYPIVNGIPRFVPDHYAKGFGL